MKRVIQKPTIVKFNTKDGKELFVNAVETSTPPSNKMKTKKIKAWVVVWKVNNDVIYLCLYKNEAGRVKYGDRNLKVLPCEIIIKLK